MSITLIRSRRRLVQANSYNSPHHRKNKRLLATTQAERAQRNRDKKRAQLEIRINLKLKKGLKELRCLIDLSIINSRIINLRMNWKN